MAEHSCSDSETEDSETEGSETEDSETEHSGFQEQNSVASSPCNGTTSHAIHCATTPNKPLIMGLSEEALKTAVARQQDGYYAITDVIAFLKGSSVKAARKDYDRLRNKLRNQKAVLIPRKIAFPRSNGQSGAEVDCYRFCDMLKILPLVPGPTGKKIQWEQANMLARVALQRATTGPVTAPSPDDDCPTVSTPRNCIPAPKAAKHPPTTASGLPVHTQTPASAATHDSNLAKDMARLLEGIERQKDGYFCAFDVIARFLTCSMKQARNCYTRLEHRLSEHSILSRSVKLKFKRKDGKSGIPIACFRKKDMYFILTLLPGKKSEALRLRLARGAADAFQPERNSPDVAGKVLLAQPGTSKTQLNNKQPTANEESSAAEKAGGRQAQLMHVLPSDSTVVKPCVWDGSDISTFSGINHLQAIKNAMRGLHSDVEIDTQPVYLGFVKPLTNEKRFMSRSLVRRWVIEHRRSIFFRDYFDEKGT